jgi:hypothetical protein
MRQLHGHQQIAVVAAALAMRAVDHVHQARNFSHAAAVDPQLTRIGAALAADRRGLEPDQLGATARESLVSPPRQLRRPAIGVAVAPFHRMDGDRVPHSGAGDDHLLRQGRADGLRIVQKSDVPRPGVGRRLPDLRHGIEMKMPHVPASTLERHDCRVQQAVALVSALSAPSALSGF